MRRLSELAEGQWGLVTTQQAREHGVGWSSLAFLHKEGLLERVHTASTGSAPAESWTTWP